ncbi:MAG: helix-turn-helix transcriptional regulator [Alysiella sp.]|uniref:helix-turn-helix domain-containing protein n=1 Tax=Alysiella sp. TaxID=1872483 RepID=UPI0026DB46AD|nr:helix-turn-helix transcriptional regulator [Alysiella sp.]MDO4434607.1 helix-turn-helix transcriptional regulator [Alysiella sp.]
MKKQRTSLYSPEMAWLRRTFVSRRLELGLSQKMLSERMGVILSYIGKVETGERRLDITEFIRYCEALELEPADVLNDLRQQMQWQHPPMPM